MSGWLGRGQILLVSWLIFLAGVLLRVTLLRGTLSLFLSNISSGRLRVDLIQDLIDRLVFQVGCLQQDRRYFVTLIQAKQAVSAFRWLLNLFCLRLNKVFKLLLLDQLAYIRFFSFYDATLGLLLS
jgi:hypothetical protein